MLLKLLASLCTAAAVVHSAAVGSEEFGIEDHINALSKRGPKDIYMKDPGVYPGGSKENYKKGWTELPPIEGAKIDNETFTVGKQGATIMTYVTKDYDPKKIKRVVVQIHGEYRDAWNQWMYANMSGTNASKLSDFSMDEVVIVAPMFLSVTDYRAYPHDSNNISTTKTLIWDENTWGDTLDAIYPAFNEKGDMDNPTYKFQTSGAKNEKSKSEKKEKRTASSNSSPTAPAKRELIGISEHDAASKGPQINSLDVLDAYVDYFTDKSRFPNLNIMVIAGFSMGGQTVNRYITFRPDTSKDSMINYWISSPGSFLYLNDSRPAPNKKCKGFNEYKYGLDGALPDYVSRSAKQNTPDIIRERYLSRKTFYFVGTEDNNSGDKSCEAKVQGKDHVDRMDNWIAKVLPYLPNNPRPGQIPPLIAYGKIVGVPHLASGVILSSAGMQTLFLEDFNGRDKNAKGPAPIQSGGQRVVTPDDDLQTTINGKPKNNALSSSSPQMMLVLITALSIVVGLLV